MTLHAHSRPTRLSVPAWLAAHPVDLGADAFLDQPLPLRAHLPGGTPEPGLPPIQPPRPGTDPLIDPDLPTPGDPPIQPPNDPTPPPLQDPPTPSPHDPPPPESDPTQPAPVIEPPGDPLPGEPLEPPAPPPTIQ